MTIETVSPSGRLKGKIALVTGAASGMGAATARRFVAEGARVVLTDIDVGPGRALTDELGDNAHFVEMNVTSAAAWEHAVAAAEGTFGPLSVLMNNAGVDALGFVEDFTDDAWQRGLSVNLHGPLLGMRAVTPSMRRAGGGSSINISSLQGREADVGLVPYVAAKFGLRGLSKSAAVELGRYGIRVNTVFPGLVMTGLTAGRPEHSMGHIPLVRPGAENRAGVPADVAALAAYLASDRASHVTGAEITIDGAKSVRFPTHIQDYSRELALLTTDAGSERR